MNLKDFVDGLSIIRSYYTNPNGDQIGIWNDEFHAHKTDTPISAVDVKKLHDLGWVQLAVYTSAAQLPDDTYLPDKDWCAIVS